MIINPLTVRFKISQHDNERLIYIANLVETTQLSRYPRPIEITHDQGREFIGHRFRKYLIEIEYGITSKISTSVNTMYIVVLELIHQVLRNLVRTFNISTQTYVDKNDPWLGSLAAAAFENGSTTDRLKCYIPGKLIFSRDMIILIKHTVNW